MRGFNMYVAA